MAVSHFWRSHPASRAALLADLEAARRAKGATVEDLADTTVTHALLAGEARDLAIVAERRTAELRAVVNAVARQEAAELGERELEAGRLRVLLSDLARTNETPV